MSEIRHTAENLRPDDFSDHPARFEEDNVDGVGRHWVWGLFWVEGDDSPRYFMRSCKRDEFSSGNIIKLGKGPYGLQTGEHHDDLAQKGIPAHYHKISDNPEVWGQETADPLCIVRYSQDEIYLKEADVFEIHGKPFPNMMFTHNESPLGNAYPLLHMYFEDKSEAELQEIEEKASIIGLSR